jgi:hypothetical protein
MSVKSVKLSKGTIPRAITSAATSRIMPETHISEVSVGARGAKGSEKRQSCKSVPGAKVAPSTKKCIVLTIRALATLSPDGSVESSLHDRAPEVQSKADPRGLSTKHQTRSAATSGPRPAPEGSFQIVPSTSAAEASTCCFWI